MSFIYDVDGDFKSEQLTKELSEFKKPEIQPKTLMQTVLDPVKKICPKAASEGGDEVFIIKSKESCDFLSDSSSHKISLALINEFGNDFFWIQIRSSYFDSEDVIPIN